MRNYETFVNISFSQGSIILDPGIVGNYSKRHRQELARGICGFFSVEWLSLLCWSGMSLTMATERLYQDVEIKKQLVGNAVYHNAKRFTGNDRDFTELFDDVYQRFIYSDLYSNITNPSALLYELTRALMEASCVVLTLRLRNGGEHMVAVGRAYGMTGIFDPNVGLINLQNNSGFDGEILNAMFRYYDVMVVDVDILQRTALIPAPHTVIRH